jgi:hypothetical protein
VGSLPAHFAGGDVLGVHGEGVSVRVRVGVREWVCGCLCVLVEMTRQAAHNVSAKRSAPIACGRSKHTPARGVRGCEDAEVTVCGAM